MVIVSVFKCRYDGELLQARFFNDSGIRTLTVNQEPEKLFL